MRKFFQVPLLFLLMCTSSLFSAEELLHEFDDDAFLSGEVATPESNLVGWSLFRSDSDDDDRYIINFTNVSVVEYLRFVSKISDVNFLFSEADLNFPITIMSEEPLTVPSIVSALIQTLRAQGFSVLEENKNLLITKNRDINQIPHLVLPDEKKAGEGYPIVTRVFRLENANLSSVASIIKPMMSQGALVETSMETRQLIVTDITTNVNKIASLIATLDTPHSPLDTEMYRAKHMAAETLIVMAKQIVQPFAEDNPLIFVAQDETNSIFIISTPHLIERAVEVMEDLDVRPKADAAGPIGDNVYLYSIKNKSAKELLEAIRDIGSELEGTGAQSIKLIAALENAKWIPDSNSLLFITDPMTEKKIEEILKTLDTVSEARNYFIYKIQKANDEQIEKSLQQLAKSLKKSSSDRDLVEAIHSMRYIKDTNSLIFTGSDDALHKLQELLPTFDVAVSEYSPTSHYWLYTPVYLSGKELERALDDLEDNLADSGLADKSLLHAIRSMKWVPSTNTLLFTGSPDALTEIQSIIKLIDIPSGAPTKIFIYKPKYISEEQIEEALDELADKLDTRNLSDRNLASAIDNMTWMQESQTFLFKADPGSIDKLETFLNDIDSPKEAETIAQTYFLYNLEYSQGNEILDHLEVVADSLPKDDPTQKAIIRVIDDITYLKETNSLLLTGPIRAVEDVKELIKQLDTKATSSPSLLKSSFYIYKPLYVSPLQLETALKETAQDLKASGLADPSLLQSIETMRVVELTNSVIFTGTKESLEKTKEIIETIDIPGAPEATLGEFAGHDFFIYKVRYVPIQNLIEMLRNFAKNLNKDRSPANVSLVKTINTVKELKETNSLLFTGPAATLEKIAELLKQLDVPGPMGEEARDVASYLIYKPVNVSGPELIEMMSDFERNLQSSGVRDPTLYETINNLRYIQRTGYILISGTPESVKQTQELLKKFDVPSLGDVGVTALPEMETSFLIYKLHYHLGGEIKEALKDIGKEVTTASPQMGEKILSAINSIQWIKITNSILATGSPEVLTQLKELIQNIDVPLRQVFIDTLIIRTRITNNQQFGLQWGSKVQYLHRFAGGVSNFATPSEGSEANRGLQPGLAAVNATRTPNANTDIPNPSTEQGGFDLGVIGDIILHKGKSFLSLGSLLTAIQSDNDSVVVLNPKIIAQDNQQSTLFVGQNIPFVGSQINTTQGGGTQTSANIEYRDVGISLSITPILGTNDVVTLNISTEISEQVDSALMAAGSDLTGLQTTRTALNARVHVPDRHFVALSGLIDDEKTHFKSSIPCLGGLPVVGAIFSSNDRLNAKDNLIIFMRPSIIDSVEEYKEITENQETLYKDLGVKQVVKEEIDEAIDWVKTPDDE